MPTSSTAPRFVATNARLVIQRGTDRLEVRKSELEEIFFDCERGAIPPVGPAYGIPTVIDESLLQVEDIYLEGGDHEELVHLNATSFADLLTGSRHCSFAG